MNCPCSKSKCHLGVFGIVPKKPQVSSQLQIKTLRNFFLGNGVNTTDFIEAANYFLKRDHKKLIELLENYCHGKLGVYMIPPMFYSQIPEAIKLSEYKVQNHEATAKGDLAERIMFFALEKYFSAEGDDVVIIHSHKFLNNKSNNEKDFIVINLTKGNTIGIVKYSFQRINYSGFF
jgi:hypothetical protein